MSRRFGCAMTPGYSDAFLAGALAAGAGLRTKSTWTLSIGEGLASLPACCWSFALASRGKFVCRV